MHVSGLNNPQRGTAEVEGLRLPTILVNERRNSTNRVFKYSLHRTAPVPK